MLPSVHVLCANPLAAWCSESAFESKSGLSVPDSGAPDWSFDGRFSSGLEFVASSGLPPLSPALLLSIGAGLYANQAP